MTVSTAISSIIDSLTLNSTKPDNGEEDEPTNNAAAAEEGSSPPNGANEDHLDLRILPKDTFSFFFCSDKKSLPFICAIIVFVLQLTLYTIIAVNIIDVENGANPFGFPANVDVVLRVSEVLAILIAIMTQDDVRKALILFGEGFKQQEVSGDEKVCPGATHAKWILSIILRAVEGLLGLFLTFLLIMRSSTVLDLLLNFLAIEFVTTLDDVVFSVAEEGFLGTRLKKETIKLSEFKYSLTRTSSKGWRITYFLLVPLIMIAFMLLGLSVIWAHQDMGKYSCEHVLIQFDDEMLPMLGTFSGVLSRKPSGGTFARFTYGPDGGPLLAYCKKEKRWTLSLAEYEGDTPDACDWIAASSEVEDFDVLTTTASPWYVKPKSVERRTIPLAQSFLSCFDCTDDLCGPNGSCSKGICQCEPGYFGLYCEYPEPCKTLEIDPRGEGFQKEGGSYFASEYYLLEGAKAYNRKFGSAISLSRESYNIVPNPRNLPDVTLAVGASAEGFVRVFVCSTIGCIQRGADIKSDGLNEFGNSISMTHDGNSIAIGGVDYVSSLESTPVSVQVFEWSTDENSWLPKGNLTSVTSASRNLAASMALLNGYYVSLSGDYLAIGSLESACESFGNTKSADVITKVFKLVDSGWMQLGDEMRREFFEGSVGDDEWPLQSVVIKGNVLAVGSDSSTAVYEWNEDDVSWIPRMIESSPEINGVGGLWVDLSEDASILAVGGKVRSSQSNNKSIQMYKWDGERYKALFNGVSGGLGNSISLSGDGKAVAVGLPFDASTGGSTSVYFDPSSPCDDPSEIPLRISFTTDSNPWATRWELRVHSEVKLSRGYFALNGYPYTTFVEEVCVPATSCVQFIVYDMEGNGCIILDSFL